MKVVVVGGSMAGLACAHALFSAGCKQVIVLEKARTLKSAGAGLALDSQTCQALAEWQLHQQLMDSTLPLTIDQNQATESKSKATRVLARDENFNCRAAHWSDLHKLLYDKLPRDTVHWGHEVVSFRQSGDGLGVTVEVKMAQTDQTIEIDGDLLVAADGSMSLIRKHFVPHQHRRYLGYCAWRGVFDYSKNDSPEMVASIKKVYPDLGKCLYFDLAKGSHSVFYELHGKRINWLWYVNQPEPHMQMNSLTAKVDKIAIEKMHEEASETWVPELSALIKATPEPFINVLYDREPLKQFVWGHVVLVGDAAHPTSPHGVRSTNMSIMDASVLGQSIAKWGFDKISTALAEYESIRLPVTSQQVLYSRHLGLLKQGFLFDPPHSFPWFEADADLCEQLLQRNMPFFKSHS
ncbi:hypothetical protein SUGI_0656960 [Cryptomeria japonica]|uniref:uncharacterized protein LOC131048623 n=1 Tax=Cryptomeria japonica TaxID=3369 RepID=UPI002414D011|nr:uncharacterized protein LOC131048623 [Cryptomeria japonica]GLJ32652.1 hypothetical protein SUGI_0656960 [Cryptomeria japonica]